jgi:peptidoglycan hydrolase-like protein with peptidoglycan-binding domain
MQQSLAQKGYDPGPQDGEARPQTYEALRKFQMDNRMAAGQITVESARALNVIP